VSTKAPKPLKALLPYKEVLEKEVWGPIYWKLLHNRAKTHGLTERWLDGFEAAIMCPLCQEHFRQMREQYPLEVFATSEAWAWFVHNRVNEERANKPFMPWREYQIVYRD
jgi:hypothetical protein